MRHRATRMGGNRAPAALAARVAALMASFSGPKVWFDPSDISMLFQDSAGTTPVTAAGDGIGRILDKSGAGNHATQTTTPSRPLWQTTYAAFDGTDDSWATASIDFTSTDKVTVIAGLRKLSDAQPGVVVELGPVYTTQGAFGVFSPPGAAVASHFLGATGSVRSSNVSVTAAAPDSAVLSGSIDLSAVVAADAIQLRRNAGVGAVSTAVLGARSFGNAALNVGRRNNASTPFNGNLYGLIIIGRLLSPDELWVCERYVAQQAGITI